MGSSVGGDRHWPRGAMPHAPHPDFATLLRHHRLVRGLTQGELAARAGVSVSSISYLERGLTRGPHRDTVRLLAEALELSPEDGRAFEQSARWARPLAARPH